MNKALLAIVSLSLLATAVFAQEPAEPKIEVLEVKQTLRCGPDDVLRPAILEGGYRFLLGGNMPKARPRLIMEVWINATVDRGMVMVYVPGSTTSCVYTGLDRMSVNTEVVRDLMTNYGQAIDLKFGPGR